MPIFNLLQVILSIVALGAAIVALIPVMTQIYFDNVCKWPYLVKFQGLLKDTTVYPNSPHKTFAFRIRNKTSQTAFFRIRIDFEPHSIDEEGRTVLEIPQYIGVWPSREKSKLYVEVPPKVWREISIRPFSPQDTRDLSKWSLLFTEYYHGNRQITYNWPSDLNMPIDVSATDIPIPPLSE